MAATLVVLLCSFASAPLASPTGDEGARLVFGGPIERAELRDEERLWVVSRGRLFEVDLCREGPQPVRLSDSGQERRARRRPDEDTELMLVAADEGLWDDRVLEELRDDLGLPEGRPATPTSSFSKVPSPVRDLVPEGDALRVISDDGGWLCRAGRAGCIPFQRRAFPEVRADAGPRLAPDEVREEETEHGRWLLGDSTIWFVPRDPEALRSWCATLRPDEGPIGPRVSALALGSRAPGAATWLPEVTVLVAREQLTRHGGHLADDVLVMLLLTFFGRAR